MEKITAANFEFLISQLGVKKPFKQNFEFNLELLLSAPKENVFVQNLHGEVLTLKKKSTQIEKTRVVEFIFIVKFQEINPCYYFCLECKKYYGMKHEGNNKAASHILEHLKTQENIDGEIYIANTVETILYNAIASSKTEIINPSIVNLDVDFLFKEHKLSPWSGNLSSIFFHLAKSAKKDQMLDISLNSSIFPFEEKELTVGVTNNTSDHFCLFSVLYYSEETKEIKILYPEPGLYLFNHIEHAKAEVHPKNEIWSPSIDDETKEKVTDFLIFYYTFFPDKKNVLKLEASEFRMKVLPIFISK